MPITLRRFPIPLGTFILLAAPFGCGSDSANHPVADGDRAVARSAPTEPVPGPAHGETGGQGQPGQIIRDTRQDVHQAAAVVEDRYGDLKGGVMRAVGEARGRVQDLPGAVRDEATQATVTVEGGMRQAVDQVVGGVKKEVEGAEGDVRRRARSVQDEVKRSAQGLKKDLVEGLFGPSRE